MRRWEINLAASFEADVGADLDVADAAAALLLTILLHAAPEKRTTDLFVAEDGTLHGDLNAVNLAAQVLIGVRAWRAMRGARAVLAAGYELECRALDRIIVELMAHRRAILDDDGGTEAVAWLKGERSWGISKRVNAMMPDGLYKNLSHDSHGDPVGVGRLMDAELQAINPTPKRTAGTRASLLMHAGFASEHALVIAQLAGLELDGVEHLTAAIDERRAALEADYPDEPGPS
jgi:hypothetical protein